jgi:UDP-GlcNAc:undecaprenyl-phosphate GlcNAc-1-phosphate transferase
MNHNWLLYIAAFAVSFAVSLLATPLARKLSVKVGAIDLPKKRGMHAEPMPRMGGVAIIMGFMAAVAVLSPFVAEIRTTQFLGFVVGALVIITAGVLDDLKGGALQPRIKLLFQIAASLIVIFSGTRIEIVMWPVTAVLSNFSAPITLVWIIGVTNAVNLIDGVDGLAAGVTAICSICLMVLCVISGSVLAVALTAILAGSTLGFLPRNFSPAEVIMGDSGALFLGYVLSVTSIMGVFKGYALLSVVIAVLSLALPIMDTLFAMLRRAIHGRPIMEADRGHLHHRLIDMGYSSKRAVAILYGLSVVSGGIAIVIALQDIRAIIVAVVFLFVMLLMLLVYRKRTAPPHSDDTQE